MIILEGQKKNITKKCVMEQSVFDSSKENNVFFFEGEVLI